MKPFILIMRYVLSTVHNTLGDVTYYYYYLDVTQHPGNDTYCEGSNAVLSCVIFDNSTNNAADATTWLIDDNPPVRVPDNMINSTRDGDVVTSVLTIESVTLNDNGTGYFCAPLFNIASYVGVVSVAGNVHIISYCR